MKAWAVIVDTDHPVHEHFSDNLCTFCTGLPTASGESQWEAQFFKDMAIDPNDQMRPGTKPVWNNPFCRDAQVVPHRSRLNPCRPWPTIGWGSNDKGRHVNFASSKDLKGYRVSEVEVFEQFTYPALMSVAILFSKQIHSLLFGIIAGRSRIFTQKYGNGYSNVTTVRMEQVDV